ncbi:MAG: hypothetical protein JNL08_05275 [Planctomycetes bacterium]|nr:hypothetical protein [Planctomycetota bacterium]
MTTSQSQPLKVGDLVGQTFSVYFRSLLPFTVLSAIVMSPWIVLLFVIEQAPSQGLVIGSGILQSVLSWVLAGAISYGVVQQMRGQAVDLGKLIGAGFRSILRVFGVSLVVGLIVGIGTLLLIVPGVIASVILFVAVPAAVVENLSISEALNRSAQLTKGSRWQVFAGALLIMLVVGGLGAVGAFVLAAAPGEAAPIWFQIAVAVVLAPFSATMYAVGYVLLRRSRENVDVGQLAAVFD